jgi:hypothetical protein
LHKYEAGEGRREEKREEKARGERLEGERREEPKNHVIKKNNTINFKEGGGGREESLVAHCFYFFSVPGLFFPFMAVIEYLGHRLIAMTCLPIGKDSLKVGTCDGANTFYHDDPVSIPSPSCPPFILFPSPTSSVPPPSPFLVHSSSPNR